MEDILTSPAWLLKMQRAAIFTHDEHFEDLVTEYNHDEDVIEVREDATIFKDFLARVTNLKDHHRSLEKWSKLTIEAFRKELMESKGYQKEVYDATKDHVITPSKRQTFIDKVREWARKTHKGSNASWLHAAPKPWKSVLIWVKSQLKVQKLPVEDIGLMNLRLGDLVQNHRNKDFRIREIESSEALEFQYYFDLEKIKRDSMPKDPKMPDDQKPENTKKNDEKTKEDFIYNLKNVVDRKFATLDIFFNDFVLADPFFPDSEITLKQILALSQNDMKQDVVQQVKKLRNNYIDYYDELNEKSKNLISEISFYYTQEEREIDPTRDLHTAIFVDLLEKIKNGTFYGNLKNYITSVATKQWITVVSKDIRDPEPENTGNDPEDADSPDTIRSARLPVPSGGENTEWSEFGTTVYEVVIDLYLEEYESRKTNPEEPGFMLAFSLNLIDSQNFSADFREWLESTEELKNYPGSQPDVEVKKAEWMLAYLRQFYPNLTDDNRRRWISTGKKNIQKAVRKRYTGEYSGR